MALLDLKLGKGHLVFASQGPLLLIDDSVLTLILLKHRESERHLTNVGVLARFCGLIKVNLDLALNVITRKIS